MRELSIIDPCRRASTPDHSQHQLFLLLIIFPHQSFGQDLYGLDPNRRSSPCGLSCVGCPCGWNTKSGDSETSPQRDVHIVFCFPGRLLTGVTARSMSTFIARDCHTRSITGCVLETVREPLMFAEDFMYKRVECQKSIRPYRGSVDLVVSVRNEFEGQI